MIPGTATNLTCDWRLPQELQASSAPSVFLAISANLSDMRLTVCARFTPTKDHCSAELSLRDDTTACRPYKFPSEPPFCLLADTSMSKSKI